ncbi:PREDICTED: putative uncharacterized protein NEXN-AS1-like [Chrysochloris asiatica]|uniref:Uncharacterized protein n=1 Tax=Chrysochloris asiatica TaxID=185453 RepID=A0A9B0TFY9_CHRAS|nr:PREDICTED: putative uncharacterized protein NEXN-AS1-like [Chrysochloris asiatica]
MARPGSRWRRRPGEKVPASRRAGLLPARQSVPARAYLQPAARPPAPMCTSPPPSAPRLSHVRCPVPLAQKALSALPTPKGALSDSGVSQDSRELPACRLPWAEFQLQQVPKWTRGTAILPAPLPPPTPGRPAVTRDSPPSASSNNYYSSALRSLRASRGACGRGSPATPAGATASRAQGTLPSAGHRAFFVSS